MVVASNHWDFYQFRKKFYQGSTTWIEWFDSTKLSFRLRSLKIFFFAEPIIEWFLLGDRIEHEGLKRISDMPHGGCRVVIHGYIHSLFNRYVSAPTAGSGFLGLITALAGLCTIMFSITAWDNALCSTAWIFRMVNTPIPGWKYGCRWGVWQVSQPCFIF